MAAAVAAAPSASADDSATQADLGTAAETGNGQQWTISNLAPSTDVIGGPVAGTLWEATATVAPVGGGIPVVPGFSARSATDSYPVLWAVPAPQGVNPSSLPAGGSTQGKLYFDVLGAAPSSVAYTAEGRDTAIWVQPPPPPATGPAPQATTSTPMWVPAQAAPAPVAPAPVPGAAGSVALRAAAVVFSNTRSWVAKVVLPAIFCRAFQYAGPGSPSSPMAKLTCQVAYVPLPRTSSVLSTVNVRGPVTLSV